MITKIHVENYVLIDRLDIDFQGGLNIITGETGAGKSILLGAIGALLGTRVEGNIMKDPSCNCVIEAHFDLQGYGLEPLFRQLDLDYDPYTVIRRVVTPAGRSRSFVNEMPVQLSLLKTLSASILDIHSQHQTLLLADETFRMNIVDAVSGTEQLLGDYRVATESYKLARNEVDKIKKEAEQAARDQEYIRFQHDLLLQAGLRKGEKEELEEQEKILSHSQEIKEALFACSSVLQEQDQSVLSGLKNVSAYLSKLSALSSDIADLSSRTDSALYELRDIARELEMMAENADDNPTLLQKTVDRLDAIYAVEQRFHTTDIDELIALRDQYSLQLDMIDDVEGVIAEKQKEVDCLYARALALAQQLHDRRVASLDGISDYLREQFIELGMENASLVLELVPSNELMSNGMESVRFLFTANKGTRSDDVQRVASGGEMSRIMLSIKSLAARYKKMPTMIFDEIDTGVSGRVAHKMGEIMQQLSSNMQIINITHLPQVASKGDHHFFVYKDNDQDATSARIRKLTPQERIEQIAAMLSGDQITQAALDQAKELLRNQ